MSTDYAARELLEAETDEELPGANTPPTLPVCVTEKVVTEEVTPQDCVTTTITLSTTTTTSEGTGIAELLPADPLRARATILPVDEDIVICHSRAQANDAANQAGSSIATVNAFGATAANPAAGTTVATTASLPAGTYTVMVWLGLGGTVNAGDGSNMQLQVGGTVIGTLLYNGSTTAVQVAQGPFTVVVPAGGATVSVVTINNAANVAAIYRAQIIATPAANTVASPNGAYQPARIPREIRTTRRMWVAAVTANPTRISVITERRQP
jgi:hypothetical protein